MQKQLALMLGRQQVFLDLEDEGLDEYDDLVELISNSHLNTNFVALAREVNSTKHLIFGASSSESSFCPL